MSKLKIEITRDTCPQCNGAMSLIGILFESVWSRCNNCGSEFMSGHTQKQLVQEKRYAPKI